MTENQQDTKELEPREVAFITSFKSMQADSHKTAVDKGWHDKRNELIRLVNENYSDTQDMRAFATKLVISQMLCLCHSEISEGLEGLRKDLDDDKIPEFSMLEAEIADTIIRFMDLAEAFNLRIAEALVAKARMNKGREFLHGGKSF